MSNFDTVYDLCFELISYIYRNCLCTEETDAIIPDLASVLEDMKDSQNI